MEMHQILTASRSDKVTIELEEKPGIGDFEMERSR